MYVMNIIKMSSPVTIPEKYGSTTFDVGEENSLTSFFYVQIENK